jgi:predicted ATP-dependent Lon-type protease
VFWKRKNQLNSENDFHEKIKEYYTDLNDGSIPKDLVERLSELITGKVYSDYIIKWKEYPKSRKRYSELKINDLEHPYTQNDVIKFFKKAAPENYRKFSSVLLKMSEVDITDFERRREQFESYF